MKGCPPFLNSRDPAGGFIQSRSRLNNPDKLHFYLIAREAPDLQMPSVEKPGLAISVNFSLGDLNWKQETPSVCKATISPSIARKLHCSGQYRVSGFLVWISGKPPPNMTVSIEELMPSEMSKPLLPIDERIACSIRKLDQEPSYRWGSANMVRARSKKLKSPKAFRPYRLRPFARASRATPHVYAPILAPLGAPVAKKYRWSTTSCGVPGST